MKTIFIKVSIVLIALSLLTACADDSVKIIKNGILNDYQTTTIGNAFDNYEGFSKVTWKAQTLPNGAHIVTVTADVPKSNWKDQRAIFLHNFNIQAINKAIIEMTFILNVDDTFTIDRCTTTYAGTDLVAIEAASQGLLGQMTENGFLIRNSGFTSFLNSIYSNTPIMF